MADERSYDPAEASHRALRGIRHELERHPAVSSARGFPVGEFTQVVATIDPKQWGFERENATLTVRWFAGETPSDHPRFSFHYSDHRTDFGYHHEPNPHVDGWGHFQERGAAGSTYTYESHSFSSLAPTRLVWEVLTDLPTRLDAA